MKGRDFLTKIVSTALTITMLCPMLLSCNLQSEEGKITTDIGQNTVELDYNIEGQDKGQVIGENKLDYTFTPSADYLTKTSIPVTSSFEIKVENTNNIENLKSSISVIPTTPIKVEEKEGEDNTYKITPVLGSWKSDTVYRVNVGNPDNPIYSYAFQTEHKFKVKSVYPGDQRTDVPLNSGIEIKFSDPVEEGFEKFIKIEPSLEVKYSTYPDRKTVIIAIDTLKNKMQANTIYTVTISGDLKSVSGTSLNKDKIFSFKTQEIEKQQMKWHPNVSVNISNYSNNNVIKPDTQNSVSVYVSGSTYSNNADIDINSKLELYKFNSSEEAYKAIVDIETNYTEYENRFKQHYFGHSTIDKVDFSNIQIDNPFEKWELTKVFEDSHSDKLQRYSKDFSISIPGLEVGTYIAKVSTDLLNKDLYSVSSDKQENAYLNITYLLIQVSNIATYNESLAGNSLLWAHDSNGNPISNATFDTTLLNRENKIFRYVDTKNKNSTIETKETSIKTDVNGVAIFDTTGYNLNITRVIKDSDYVITLGNLSNSEIDTNVYFNYIYTDREVYFGSDKVNFFGLIGETKGGSEIPKVLYLTSPTGERGVAVEVDPYGFFSGSIEYENWNTDGLYFTLENEDYNIEIKKYISITKQDKPVYKITSSFDKLYYNYGDKAIVTANVSFFDGTPAQGIQLMFADNVFSVNETKKTDKNGDVTFSIDLKNLSNSDLNIRSTNPITIMAHVQIVGLEVSTGMSICNAKLFPSDTYFNGKRVDNEYVEITLNKVDTSVIKTEDDLKWNVFPNNTIGKGIDGQVNVKLIQTEYIKTHTGTRYDAILKQSIPVYKYSSKETVLSSTSEKISDGTLKLDLLPEDTSINGYKNYIITWTDKLSGIEYELSFSAEKSKYYYRNNYSNMNSYPNFEIEVTYDGESLDLGDKVKLEVKYGEKYLNTVGEADKNKLDIPVINTLYLASSGYKDYKYSPVREIEFTEENVFGTDVLFTIFIDGEYRLLNSQDLLVYDYIKNNSVDIKVKTDKNTYKPGENATIIVKTDKGFSGKALISLVDEACFALGDQLINPLQAYLAACSSYNRNYSYGYIPHYYMDYMYSDTQELNQLMPINRYINVTRNSYFMSLINSYGGLRYSDVAFDGIANGAVIESIQGVADSAGTKGESSSEITTYVRSLFLDNPYFEIVDIVDGVGKLEIKVPDNITTWRATTIAFSGTGSSDIGKLKIGSTTSDVLCTQPYFITVSCNDYYLDTDKIGLTLRSFGFEQSDSAEYTLKLLNDSNEEIESKTYKGKFDETIMVDLGELQIGHYKILVTGQISDQYSDAVIKTFDVVDSAMIMSITKQLSIDDISKLQPKAFPVKLTIHNDTYDVYLKVLNKVRWLSWARNDFFAASITADKAIQKLYGNENTWYSSRFNNSQNLDSIELHSGLVPLNSFAEGDIELTARMLAATPDVFSDYSKNIIHQELLNRIENYEEDFDEIELSALMLGLAYFKEPVLNDIHLLIDLVDSVEAKLYLSAALAQIGDYAGASKVYTEINQNIADNKNISAEQLLKYKAFSILTAVHIDKEEATKLVEYVISHHSEFEIYNLELAAYLHYYMPTEVKNISFKISRGTEGNKSYITEDIVLNTGEYYTVVLNKNDLKTLIITPTNETSEQDIICTVTFAGGMSDLPSDVSSNNNIKITRTIKKLSELSKDEVRAVEEYIGDVSNLYMVTIGYSVTFTENYTYLQISDTIPSGARYVLGDNYIPYYLDGQHLSGSLYLSKPSSMRKTNSDGIKMPSELVPYTATGEIAYIIRGATPGEYTYEPVVVWDKSNNTYNLSNEAILNIK